MTVVVVLRWGDFKAYHECHEKYQLIMSLRFDPPKVGPSRIVQKYLCLLNAISQVSDPVSSPRSCPNDTSAEVDNSGAWWPFKTNILLLWLIILHNWKLSRKEVAPAMNVDQHPSVPSFHFLLSTSRRLFIEGKFLTRILIYKTNIWLQIRDRKYPFNIFAGFFKHFCLWFLNFCLRNGVWSASDDFRSCPSTDFKFLDIIQRQVLRRNLQRSPHLPAFIS